MISLKQKEGVTLPHERELFEIVDMARKAYEDENYIGVFVTDNFQQVHHLLSLLKHSVEWDKANVKILREGIEVVDGGKIIGTSLLSTSRLRGVSASEIVIFGGIGEFFYCAQASLSKTRGEMRFVV